MASFFLPFEHCSYLPSGIDPSRLDARGPEQAKANPYCHVLINLLSGLVGQLKQIISNWGELSWKSTYFSPQSKQVVYLGRVPREQAEEVGRLRWEKEVSLISD